MLLHWCTTIRATVFLADFEIIPIEAVRGQIFFLFLFQHTNLKREYYLHGVNSLILNQKLFFPVVDSSETCIQMCINSIATFLLLKHFLQHCTVITRHDFLSTC
jgi:hypothetical protein